MFLIKEDGKDDKGQPILKVTRTFVKTGERFDNRVAIVSGLRPGDRVAASGQLKLNSGVQVLINDSGSLQTPTTVPTN